MLLISETRRASAGRPPRMVGHHSSVPSPDREDRVKTGNSELTKLYDERDHLKILINLLEQGDDTHDPEIEAARAKLSEQERLIDAAFREAKDPPSARWRRSL
jgi:hypothetical protein